MFYKLGDSMFNADAHFWYTRTQAFTKAVLRADWAGTYQNPKPGVTVMWMSGFFLESFLRIYEKIYHFRPLLYTFETFPYTEIAVKLPLVILTIFSLLFFYKWLKEILGNGMALTATIILAFQPFYIGVSRYFHGDGTLTSFMLLSTFSCFMYIFKNQNKYLVLSAFFGGLAFLTKMQGIFLLLYVPLTLLLSTRALKKTALLVITWWAIAVVTIFLFFPALWVKPVETLKSMFFEAQVVTEEGRNDGDGSNLAYLKAVPTILPASTIFLFLFGIFWIAKNRKYLDPIHKNIFIYTFAYIFFYSIQTALVFQKSERYLLPLFPLIAIISAYAFETLASRIKKLTPMTLRFMLLGFTASYVSTFAPHYTAMTEVNPWGSLYSEAAAYLNQKPNASELKVVAVTKEHTFRPFFKGKTYGKGETLPNGWTADYLIVHDNSYIPEKYNYCTFEHEIIFKKRVFWEIYKCK